MHVDHLKKIHMDIPTSICPFIVVMWQPANKIEQDGKMIHLLFHLKHPKTLAHWVNFWWFGSSPLPKLLPQNLVGRVNRLIRPAEGKSMF